MSRLSVELAGRFVHLHLDDGARGYIDSALASRPGRVRTSVHRLLRPWLSDFDVNGLLGMYPMHLLSTEQARRLLGGRPGGRLLDVGAGSGDVTSALAPLFDHVATTETSRMMARRLRKRGFVCHRTDVTEGQVPDGPHDVVACLNVIDRCDHPWRLLEGLHAGLVPGGRLLLSSPLPYDPLVYAGGTSHDPLDPLPLSEPTWEGAVGQLVERVLEPLGFEQLGLARLPYLSGGDVNRPLYVLDAAVIVCRRT